MIKARDDVPQVRELLASSAPVVLLLATEFAAAMSPWSPELVEGACLELGFHAVEDTYLGEESVAAAYEALAEGWEDRVPGSILRSTCPVVTRLICVYRPDFIGALAPIAPPYIVHARTIRAMYGKPDVKIVYVSPCYARKGERLSSGLTGAVDAVIGFDELKRMLDGEMSPRKNDEPLDRTVRASSLGRAKSYSLTDGFPRSFLESAELNGGDIVTVRGAEAIMRFLDAAEAGEARPRVADLLFCDSCVDGPAMGIEKSSYARRMTKAAPLEAGMFPRVTSVELLACVPRVDMARVFHPAPVNHSRFDEEAVEAALVNGGFSGRDRVVDCGACGFSTCADHARAVLDGLSSWGSCVQMRARALEARVAELEHSSTVDALTGLGNRHVFETRIESEFARFRRYGTPFSLLMVDLDGFKSINDEHGHVAGDAVLRAVADAMRSVLRDSDIAVRYGGDEFAIILPQIDRAAGYAVAEKLRAAVSRVGVDADRAMLSSLAVTASIGMASACLSMADSTELLESADRALYRAKESGRDRVRLAPQHGGW